MKELLQAANCTGPVGAKDAQGTLYFNSDTKRNRRETANVTVTAATGTVIDLDSIFGVGRWNYRYLRMICTQDYEFYFTPFSTSGITINMKGATDGTEGELQIANTADQMIPTGRFLVVDPAANGTINLSLRSPSVLQQAT